MLGLLRQCGPTAFETFVYMAGLYLLTGACGEVFRFRIEVAGDIPRREFGGDASWNAYGDAMFVYYIIPTGISVVDLLVVVVVL
ncbi:hypothetical protein K440DRAFT_27454 [Wilcoxina mikolae CBS 423.85]|nr:hypothetical protein K440DRAFT_27454 [Wilcoxina mikolae CBS 423.85]